MKFELLPNEIFIECFEYFNVLEIYYSFDVLNSRFNKLIRNIPLNIDFQNVRKKLFDEFSYLQSLTLIQVQEKNMEKLKTILPLILQLYSFRLIDSHIDISNGLPYSKLQTLYMPRLDFLPIFPDNSSSIINLTIYYCSFNKLSQYSTYFGL
jgi:hypothetical protein